MSFHKIKKYLLPGAATLLFALILILAVSVIALAAPDYGITPAEIDTMAIDPQSWRLHRDSTWADLKKNPVVDWNKELNPAGLENPRAAGNTSFIEGGVVLCDYLDRKFISGLETNDVLGYLLMKEDGSGYDVARGIVKNPVIRVQDFPDRYPGGYKDLPKFWQDYLNDPTFTQVNRGSTIDEFWRELTYGKWAVNLTGYGVYTLPYFEFELMGTYMGSFNTWNDIPPSFRFGNPTQATVSTSGTGNSRSIALDPHMAEVSRTGAADSPGNAYGLPANMPGLSRATPTKYGDFDFYFNLHAGYCTSGSWQPFGVLQFPTRQDVTTHLTPGYGVDPSITDLGPMGRLKMVEEFFNTYPEWIPIYADRYSSGWTNNTAAWNTARYNANDPVAVARVAEYRTTRFWADTLAAYNAAVAAGQKYTFKLSKEDYDWADAYHAAKDYVGLDHARNTRYVSFTSWEGSVGEWSHQTSRSFGSGFGQLGTWPGRSGSLNFSTQGENSGMGTFAHEFGHVAGWPDNYGSPWADNRTPATEYWDIMSRGSFGGPFGDLARWTVPGIEGGTFPVHAMFGLKNRGAASRTFYTEGDKLIVTKQGLASSTPVVAEIVPRNIPLNTQYNDFGIPRRNAAGEGFVKALQLDFGSNTWADTATLTASNGLAEFRRRAVTMAVEVIDQSGYDSFIMDTGVMISRVDTISSGSRDVVTAHLYDIDMVDYFSNGKDPFKREGNWTRYVVAHASQQVNALFKAGKSYTDTGYYGSIRDVAPGNNIRSFPTTFLDTFQDGRAGNGRVIVPGSVRKGEAQDGRPIVSGDTVNEWKDVANGLHFYILQKNYNEVLPHGVAGHYDHKPFLSYTVAVRHNNGTPVGGNLILAEKGALTTATVGNYAKQTYTLTNTGTATDIVRITLNGTMAAGRTQIIKVPVDGALPASVNEAGTAYTYNPNGREIYKDRVVPTFYSEQNAVLLNDLYAVGAGETVEFDVYVKNTGGTAPGTLSILARSETNSTKQAEVTGPDPVVGGALTVKLVAVQQAAPGKVASANFTVTNTGDAIDVVTLSLAGYLPGEITQTLFEIEAGQTITVPMTVLLPDNIKSQDLTGKIITLTAQSETNSTKVGSAFVRVAALVNFEFSVETGEDQFASPGQIIEIPIILGGNLNYTQFATDVLFTESVLEYVSADLSGAIKTCAKTAAGKLTLRTVPSTNMVIGAPPGPIGVLKFKVKATATAGQKADISFANTVINAPAGYLGAIFSPPQGMTVNVK